MSLRSAMKTLGHKILPRQVYEKCLRGYTRAEARLARLNHAKAFKKKGTPPIKMVFLVYVPQGWNSLKSVYQAAVASDAVEPYVVVSPEVIDGRLVCPDGAYEYFASEVPEAINAYEDGVLFDLKAFEPDIVFRQTPYDHVYPKPYRADGLARYSKLCYVPYNYNFSPKKHLEIEYNPRFMMNVFATFEESTSNYQYCEDLRRDIYPDLHVYNLGFPRFDLLREMDDPRNGQAKVFAWIPRWSVDSVNNDATNFFNYIDALIDYFDEHQDCSLIIRPHQAMFPNFIRLGLMSEDDVSEFKRYIAGLPNVEMDDNFDYLVLVEKSDAFIADFSSLVVEFYLTGKPIIYCGDPSEHNAETAHMVELLYKANDWEELRRYIDLLREGVDELRDARQLDAQAILSGLPDDIGEAIVEQCVRLCC